MVKILICDDDPTFAQSMFKRILSLPAYSSKSMKLSCLTDIAEMSANTTHNMTFYFSILTSVKKAELTLPERCAR